MKTSEIRESFLRYFEKHGHRIVPSSSLIPAGDPTLLFVNAGMVQFKDCFLGTDKRDYQRATTCQKSLRISGKHNDLENVGRTARHHTFFEMLGNFSFGDYFKKDAIQFAWEYLTGVLALDKDRLWVTVFEEDDEAAQLWSELTDVRPGRILKCGKDDNFWAMGETGPCGPCTEIHYFLGGDVAKQSEDEFRKGDGTYIEIWNLVFMQFDRSPNGTLTPLPKPSVDTGMGLERIAAVKQGVRSNYDIDSIREQITLTEQMSGKKYLGHDYTARDAEADPQYGYDVAMRVIADHSRACAVLIADGVNPSSDGRGYVLRRLIRRACRHGRVLGFNQPFLYKVCDKVVDIMGGVYPELAESRNKIKKMIAAEEEKFLATLDTGLSILDREAKAVAACSGRVLPGRIAFSLHDTYGFPLDLTEDLIKRHGLQVDLDGFHSEMNAQRERSRQARSQEIELLLQRSVKPFDTKFVGYEFDQYESNVLGIFDQNGELKEAPAGGDVAVVIRETPFYAEVGGQVGDSGTISSNNATLEVLDTQKGAGDTIIHLCRVVEGALAVGDAARLQIDSERRKKIRANHSATHLLHQALREVVGDHVKQAGSRVSDQSYRFDFNHYEAVTPAQVEEIEVRVNQLIQENHPVTTDVLPLDEAKRRGATALFGEKYGAIVRMVTIGPGSKELCGGTHAGRSGDLGFSMVAAEGSISAGVRRIEAVAGLGAVKHLMTQQQILKSLTGALKVSDRDVVERVERLLERNQQLERELDRVQAKIHGSASADLTKQASVGKGGVKVVAHHVDQASPKQLREVADDLRQRLGTGCIALASVSDGKAILLTAVTDDLVGKFHAGDLMKEISSVVGGRGGGKADIAQAGGGDPGKIDQALKRFQELLL